MHANVGSNDGMTEESDCVGRQHAHPKDLVVGSYRRPLRNSTCKLEIYYSRATPSYLQEIRRPKKITPVR